MNFISKLAWTSKMAKFVQLSKDIVNIRGVTDPTSEDGDEQVHGCRRWGSNLDILGIMTDDINQPVNK